MANSTPEASAAWWRDQIKTADLLADPLLATAPDTPVFGLNLACAYPFPAELEPAYADLWGRLRGLGPEAYVYPFWQTHVTIATLVNFARTQRPTASERRELEDLTHRLIRLLDSRLTLGEGGRLPPFRLEFGRPVLTRRAAIIPIQNQSGEIACLRRNVQQLIAEDAELASALARWGMNVPKIIHATIMRLVEAPLAPDQFLARFEAAAGSVVLGSARIDAVLLTVETQPYMREGKVLHRFGLF